jgi:hypothetical protein
MQANPEKFQAMAIGDNTHKHNITLNLNGCNISCDDQNHEIREALSSSKDLITVAK